MSDTMIELAFLRNHLFSEVFTEEDENLLNIVKNNISNLNTPFKDLALHAITNCENDIHAGNLKSAGYELNLIHNFHFNNTESWNSRYFYTSELLSYLEETRDLERIKKLIHELSKLETNLNKK